MRALLAIACLASLVAGEPWAASHPRREAPAPTALALSDVAGEAMGAMHQDGSTDVAELEAMLGRIRDRVAAQAVAPDVDDAAPDAGDGWRLWAFWAIDAPECDGLAEALVKARATGLASVRAIHLASLRAVEEHFFRMNDYREQMIAAAKAQDQGRCDAIAVAWRAEMAEGGAMSRVFHRRAVPLISRVEEALALRVESVPCFRLVSPAGRVHALDGFARGVDLGGWIARCRAWEDELERRAAEGGR